MEPVILVEDIYKSYGTVHALEGVGFQVHRGAIVGLLGPNGAGKTTLINILTTLLKPDKGRAWVAGIDVAQNPAAVRSRIGLAGQFAAVDENLTGKENLELVGTLYHLPPKQVKDRAEQLLREFSLDDAANRQAKTYSGGMRRRLDVASSLIGRPEVLFLDEPTTGLDPQSRMELWQAIRKLANNGTTVLLTTQYLEEADYLADAIVIIDHGKVVAQGTAKELKATIGGGVLKIHTPKQNVPALVQALSEFNPHADTALGIVTIPVKEGIKILPEAIRKIDAANITISDIELSKPTLDEVFTSLTNKK
ncbi:MAG TPA: ATP-binding cassette domain-containing protein [Negativicutes bacterium]|nr:ATP-binding cassette domain-containing protein [Negativicutes bacterium]